MKNVPPVEQQQQRLGMRGALRTRNNRQQGLDRGERGGEHPKKKKNKKKNARSLLMSQAFKMIEKQDKQRKSSGGTDRLEEPGGQEVDDLGGSPALSPGLIGLRSEYANRGGGEKA